MNIFSPKNLDMKFCRILNLKFSRLNFLCAVVIATSFMTLKSASAQEACVITSDGQTVCGEIFNTGSQKDREVLGTASRSYVDTVNYNNTGLTEIEITKCSSSYQDITCDFKVKALEKASQTFSISVGPGRLTRLIDQSGNVYGPSWIKLGNQSRDYGRISIKLEKDIPILGIIKFNTEGIDVTKINLLEITDGYKSAKFKDISVTKID